jgi:hypothetical protein
MTNDITANTTTTEGTDMTKAILDLLAPLFSGGTINPPTIAEFTLMNPRGGAAGETIITINKFTPSSIELCVGDKTVFLFSLTTTGAFVTAVDYTDPSAPRESDIWLVL